MNPEFSSMSSSTIESIRKAGIGRRGGVKVRGGRLPPVKIHNVLSKKKTIAPKIPQKRSEVKKERIDKGAFDELPFREVSKFREQRDRGRGRGRVARVYIQTEGTLFGEGMTSEAKSQRNFSSHERNVPRSKVSTIIKETGNAEGIDHLLESYDTSDDESDIENDLKPVKYPYVKEKQEIKQEIKQEVKQEIKDEACPNVPNEKNFSVEEIEKFIKVEPKDDDEKEEKPKPLLSKFFTPIEAANLSAENKLFADLNNEKGNEGIMLLIQLPSCFPFNKQSDNLNSSEGKKPTISASKEKTMNNNQDEETRIKSHIRDMPEGLIGKLQFLKSGKMRLVMDSIQFYLENGSSSHVQANAVSISIKGKEGKIIILGKIDRKMLFRPHFNEITG